MNTVTTLLLGILCLAKGGCWASTVEGYAGGSIIIKCKYDEKHRDKSKYFCKKEDNVVIAKYRCKIQIRSNQQEWHRQDRFSVCDNKDKGFLTVIIRDLTKSDEGTYWCVVEKGLYIDEYTEVNLKVNEGKPPTIEVTGHVRGAVMMQCSFLHTYTNNKKYFCKVNSLGPGCKDQIETHATDQWKTSGRFSLFYNSSGNFSLVKIGELTGEDTGTYRCALDMPFSFQRQVTVNEYTEVNLHVTEDTSFRENYKQIKTITGEPVNITCEYPDQHRDNPKFFCKENKHLECRYTFHSQNNRRETDPDVYSLHDNKEDGLLVVSFRNITTYDSGQYWCGVEVNWVSGGYKVFIIKITLYVSASTSPSNSPPRPPTKISSTSSSSTSTTASLSLTPHQRLAHQNQGFPVVLSVPVVIIVVAIGVIVFVCLRRRKSRGKDPTSGCTNSEGNNRVIAPADCDYELITDTGISASGPDTVYAQVQLPTNPSYDSTYSNVQLHISPGGDITDPQDPNYASVTFQNIPSSNDDSVTLNKEELSSDYATVKSPSHS